MMIRILLILSLAFASCSPRTHDASKVTTKAPLDSRFPPPRIAACKRHNFTKPINSIRL